MNSKISVTEFFKRPSAFLPMVMSLIAIAVIGVHLSRFGTAAQSDEGTAAHLWQLLMVLQLPIGAFFLIKWAPQAPRSAAIVVAAQLVAALAAFAPVYFLKW